jgi:uncharacterized membrane protein YdbT with pleckstrin-like domain
MRIYDTVEQHLAGDEKLVHVGRLSWIVVIGAAAEILGALIILAVVNKPALEGDMTSNPQQWITSLWNDPGSILYYPALFVLISGIFMFGRQFIRKLTTTLSTTSRRVVYEHGLIFRTANEMKRSVIEGVVVEQSLLGRILNYATIRVSGIGAGTLIVGALHDPHRFQAKLMGQGQQHNNPEPTGEKKAKKSPE